MRRNLATALTILGMPLAASHALAAEPAPAGATATVEIKMTVREKTKAEFHSTAIERVLNAQCVMQAGQASQVGSQGMTPEQQAAMEASTAKAQDVQQQFAPSDEMLANLEAEAAKCGSDEACLTALAMKLSQTQEMQAMAQQAPAAQGGDAGINPDLGPARYQMWQPQSCTGTVTVNDTYVDSDPGGEGGDGAYTDTTTAKGSAQDHARLARPGDRDRRRGEHHPIHPGASAAGHHRHQQLAHRRGRAPDPVPRRHQAAGQLRPLQRRRRQAQGRGQGRRRLDQRGVGVEEVSG